MGTQQGFYPLIPKTGLSVGHIFITVFRNTMNCDETKIISETLRSRIGEGKVEGMEEVIGEEEGGASERQIDFNFFFLSFFHLSFIFYFYFFFLLSFCLYCCWERPHFL